MCIEGGSAKYKVEIRHLVCIHRVSPLSTFPTLLLFSLQYHFHLDLFGSTLSIYTMLDTNVLYLHTALR